MARARLAGAPGSGRPATRPATSSGPGAGAGRGCSSPRTSTRCSPRGHAARRPPRRARRSSARGSATTRPRSWWRSTSSSRLLEQSMPAAGAVAFTVGEEGLGNLRGALAACEALGPAARVAVEGHGLEHVLVDAVGASARASRVTGPGGHSWVDRGPPSAVHALLELAVGARRRRDPTTSRSTSGSSRAGARSTRSPTPPSSRSRRGRSTRSRLEAFGRTLAGLAVPPPLALGVEVVGRRGAGRLDRDHELLRVAREVRSGARPSGRARPGLDRRERRARARHPGADARRLPRGRDALASRSGSTPARSTSAWRRWRAFFAGCSALDPCPRARVGWPLVSDI